MATENPVPRSEESTDVSPPVAELLPPARDSILACRSALSTIQPPLPKSPTEDVARGCTACGCDVEPLHRLKQDEAVQNLCSSCILFLYKGMYCCLCFTVYVNFAEGSDSARFTCVKCHRTSHPACARTCNLLTNSASFTCNDCSKLEKVAIKNRGTSTGDCTENGSAPLKKLRLSIDQQISPEEALTAAHIVAFLAVRQAKDAKARARALAGAAAGAASRAKTALDTAYKAALEEARWKPESSRRFAGVLPGKNRGLLSLSMVNAPAISRTDGRVSMTNFSHLHSHSLGKEPTSIVYTPLNARFSAPYNKMKGLHPGAEARKTSTSSHDAFPRASVFQKPQAVCVQGVDHSSLVESEGALVSASPASILDAARSLDTPRLSSSTESSSAHIGTPKPTEKTSSSCMVLTRNDLAVVPVSKDQLTNIDNKAGEEVSIPAS